MSTESLKRRLATMERQFARQDRACGYKPRKRSRKQQRQFTDLLVIAALLIVVVAATVG